jgi:hypothetical protein
LHHKIYARDLTLADPTRHINSELRLAYDNESSGLNQVRKADQSFSKKKYEKLRGFSNDQPRNSKNNKFFLLNKASLGQNSVSIKTSFTKLTIHFFYLIYYF